jgi:predicted RNase H-like nuclease (RuvC/YqgF family)
VIQLAVLRCERKALCGFVAPTLHEYSQHTLKCLACKIVLHELEHAKLTQAADTLKADNASLKRQVTQLTAANERLKRQCCEKTSVKKKQENTIDELQAENAKLKKDLKFANSIVDQETETDDENYSDSC